MLVINLTTLGMLISNRQQGSVMSFIAWIVLGLVVYFYFRARSPEKLTAVGSFLAEENLSEDRLMLDSTHHAGVES